MKSTTLFLIGGLAFAGTALAGDPTPQQSTTAPSLKVGIDKKTGKLRPLTPEESAALDARPANGTQGIKARTGRSVAPSKSRYPATIEESMANKRVVHGLVGFKPTEDLMSSMTVTRNADGTLVFSEDGQSSQPAKAKEMASE